MNNNPIGIFDSGAGGLSTLPAIMSVMPNEDIVYLGDSARAPYGAKSPRVITEYTKQDINFLLSRGAKIIISACGTASSVALPKLQNDFNTPIFGIIDALVDEARMVTKTKNIGVIATKATIHSHSYESAFYYKDKYIKVTSLACPLFVSLVEEGYLDHEVTRLIAQDYMRVFKENNIDTLVLGCTHFPLLKNVLQKVLGPSIKLVEAGEALANKISAFLVKKQLVSSNEKSGQAHFYTTDSDSFVPVAEMFFGKNIDKCEEVSL